MDLFTAPAELIDEDSVRRFVTDAIAASWQAESRVVEFKRERSGSNVVKTVAAMSNTDGGLIFVGVDEATPDDPVIGVSAREIDSIVGQLRAHLPSVPVETISVRLTDSPGDRRPSPNRRRASRRPLPEPPDHPRGRMRR